MKAHIVSTSSMKTSIAPAYEIVINHEGFSSFSWTLDEHRCTVIVIQRMCITKFLQWVTLSFSIPSLYPHFIIARHRYVIHMQCLLKFLNFGYLNVVIWWFDVVVWWSDYSLIWPRRHVFSKQKLDVSGGQWNREKLLTFQKKKI